MLSRRPASGSRLRATCGDIAGLPATDGLAITTRAGYQVRDRGLLASAAARPAASAFGEDAYPTLALKAAALVESINRTHPLVDGNERLSWFCAVVFLRLNGFDIAAETDDAERLIVGDAAGTAGLAMIAGWIESHAVRFRGDRP